MIWDTMDELSRMREYIDRIFSRNAEERSLLSGDGTELPRIPVCNIKEKENNIEVELEMPGISKENINLEVTDDYLEVKGKEKKERKEEKEYSSESTVFYRKIPINYDINPDEAKAEFKDGLLKVNIPVKNIENKKQKKIEIK
ncbi:MAG: Hsp20/alpha crystallin family protein [Nanobdellota archaeon]